MPRKTKSDKHSIALGALLAAWRPGMRMDSLVEDYQKMLGLLPGTARERVARGLYARGFVASVDGIGVERVERIRPQFHQEIN